jgi:hypothetical protein
MVSNPSLYNVRIHPADLNTTHDAIISLLTDRTPGLLALVGFLEIHTLSASRSKVKATVHFTTVGHIGYLFPRVYGSK